MEHGPMKLSDNFTLNEFVRSQIAEANGIDNKPNSSQLKNIEQLSIQVLQPLRNLLNRKIFISSGFRNAKVNSLAGGVKTSHHLCNDLYAAADINAEGMTPRELFDFIRQNQHQIPFEQVINEFNRWVHISYRRGKHETLIASKVNGKTVFKHAEASTLV